MRAGGEGTYLVPQEAGPQLDGDTGVEQQAPLEGIHPQAACQFASRLWHDLHQAYGARVGYGTLVEVALLTDHRQHQVRVDAGFP